MTTQYTPTLKLALPVTGELSGTWGDVVNDNITSMIEQAIAGLATINTWTANAHTLTTANGTTSESRCAMLVAATGSGGTAITGAGEIVCPAAAKLYVLQNNTSYAVTLKTASGTGVAVAAGDTAFLFCDGTNVNSCVTTIVNGHITGNLTVDGNATINGNTTLGNATSDTVTVTARVASNVLPSADNTYDLGASANAWKDLYIDGTATMALVAISGGTINGVSIGATTPATFLAVDNLSLNGNTIASTDTNGNIVIAPNGTGDVQLDADTVRVGDSGAAATLTSNGAGALTVTTGGAADLTLSTNSGTDSGTVVIANGANGNITLTPNGTGDVILSADRVQIGDSNTDTTLTTNGTGSLNLTTNNGTNSGTIQIAQGANGNITLTPNGTGSVSVPKLVWSNGTATRVPYLTTGGQFTDSANLTFNGTDLTVSGAVNAGTINATTLDLTNLEVTNIKAKDGTAGMQIADSTGVVSFTANPVLSGGTANGVLYLNGSKVATSGSALTFSGANLGVGATLNAWSSFTGLQVGPTGSLSNSGTGTPVTAVSNNAYYDGTNWVYINTAAAAQYQLSTSQHIWRYAASGSGNITWSEAMRVDTSGVFSTQKDATIYGVTVGRGAGAVATNTAVGASALAANTTGDLSVAVGTNALRTQETGQHNISIGHNSGYSLVSAERNVLIGSNAYYSFTGTGSTANVAIGLNSGFYATTGSNNVSVGTYSLNGVNTSPGVTGSYNVAVGTSAMGSASTGNYNTAVGGQALQANTTASGNTAMGYQAGYSNATGTYHTLVGYQAGYSVASNTSVTAVGYQAGRLATGGDNTFVGTVAGAGVTTGTGNTIIGAGAGSSSTGSKNTFVGPNRSSTAVAYAMTTGSANTILGGFSGNEGGLDIRTSNNVIVLSDGDGNTGMVIYKNSGGSYFLTGPTKTDPSGSSYYSTISSNGSDVQVILQRTGTGAGWGGIGASDGYALNVYSQSFAGTPLRVSTDGVLVLKGGTGSPNGTGIAFPAVQNASSDANTLDDYEEGTWTATMEPSSGFTPTSNTATGYYVKIGKQVTVTVTCNMTTPASIGSYQNDNVNYSVYVTGLPFSVGAAVSLRSAPVIGVYNGMATNSGVLSGHGNDGASSISIFQNKDSGASRTSPTLSTSTNISMHLCFTYFIG